MNKPYIAHVALFIVALIYSANYTIAKEVMPNYLQPFGFIVLRVVAGMVLFWIFHTLFVKEKIARKDLPMLTACGVFGVAVNQLCFFKGLNWTTPINASLIMLCTPIMVLVISTLLGREKITFLKIVGVVIGATGAAILISYGQQVAVNPNGWKGDILIFVNATSYALYLVLVKSMIAKYHPITVVKWIFIFGFIMVIPFGWQDLMTTDWQAIPFNIWAAIAYVLVFVTFVAFLFNAFALSRVSSTVVSAYIYLQPILASVIAISFGKDELTVTKFIASVFIFVGVYLLSKAPKKMVEVTE